MRALLHIAPLLVAGAAGCGAAACTDPCPGAVRVDLVEQRVQLGLEPFTHCTAPSGLVVSFPEYPNDEAACEQHRAEWLRVVGET